MYYTKHVPSQRNDDFHSNLDSAFLLTDVPDICGEGVDEDDVLRNYEAHYDQAEEVQLETPLDVEERVQGGRLFTGRSQNMVSGKFWKSGKSKFVKRYRAKSAKKGQNFLGYLIHKK